MSGEIGEIRGDLVIGADLKGLDAGESALKGLQAGSDAASESIGGLGQAATGGVQATVDLGNATAQAAQGIKGLASAVGDAVSQAADYQLAITNVSTLGDEAAAHFDEFHAQILNVSSALGQDATQAATGLYNALSAGVPADNAISFMETAGKAAVAGVSDINTAVGALSVGVNAFNLGAGQTERVSDALFTTVKLGVTNFGELGSAFGGVAGIAASSNATIEETLASLAQITTKGFSTSQAVTGLKAAFVGLSNPMVDAALKARGFADGADAVKKIGLQGVFEAIREEAEATGTPLIKMVGSSEALNAILSTTGENSAAARDKLAQFGDTAGATADAFKLIEATPAQKLKVLEAEASNLKTTLGNALLPILGALLDGVNPLIQGLTRFASGVLVPLSSAFSALPGPIKIVIAGMVGLTVAGAALLLSVIGLQVAFGPAIAAITAAGGVSAVATLGFESLGTAASGLYATLAPLLLPLAALVGAVALVGGSLAASTKAWDAEKQAAVEAGGSYDAFVQAAARARTESSGLAKLGFELKDAFAQDKDTLTIMGAGLRENLAEATGGFKLLWGVISGVPDESDTIAKFNKELATNKQVTIDAGAAFLELGTNMSPAVRESDTFQLAQAQLNEAFRNGKLTAEQYKAQLLQLADSTSKAAGQGAVLTKSQQEYADTQAKSLDHLAEYSLGLSETQRQSAGYQATLKALSEGVAQHTISLNDAQSAMAGYASNQVAATKTAEQALLTYGLTADGLSVATRSSAEFKDEVKAQAEAVAAGSYSLDEAKQRLADFGQQMDAAADQGAQLSTSLQSFGLSFVAPDSDAAKDLNKQMEAAAGDRSKILSEMYQAEQKFHTDRAGLVSDNAQRLADAEAKAQESIAKAEKGGNAERIAEARQAAAERVAETQKENGEKLAALESGFAAEQQARKRAIAQSIIDETNAALLSGKLGADGEQRAMAILGSLRTAFGDLTAIDPTAELAVKVNAAASQMLYGTAEASAAASQTLVSTLQNSDSAVAESAAHVEAYNQQADAAWAAQAGSAGVATQAINENTLAVGNAAAGSALLAEGMNTSAKAAADGFAVIPAAANAAAGGVSQADADMRAAADLTTGNLQANADARNTTREAELQQQLATGGGIRSDLDATGASTVAWADTTQQAAGQAGQAHAGMAQQVQTSGQQVAQTHSRMQGEMATTGTIATGSIGGLGKTYTGAAADIKSGGAEIVKASNSTNASLRTMGEGTTGAVAPARASIQGLTADVQTLGDSAGQVGDSRVEAEEGAADAAKSAGNDTVSSFQDQTKAGTALERKLADLRKAFEGLPKKIDIPLTVSGLDKAHKAFLDLQKDIKAATGKFTVEIVGKYTGAGAMKPGNSIQLQHDIEDAIAAAKPGANLTGTYYGSGAMGWSNQGLALATALSGLGKGVNPFVLQAEVEASAAFQRLIFDQATIQANLEATNRAYFDLTRQINEMGNAINRAGTAAEGARQAIQGALQGFFQGGGLDAIIAKFRELKIELGSEFFVQAGILDASTFADVQRQIAALAGEPDKQQDLWDALIDGLTNRWKVYYEDQSNALKQQKAALERQIRDIKHADPEAETEDLDKALEDINYQLDLLKDKNDDIANTFRDQTFQVGAQYDAWDRINDALEDQKKLQADLERQREKALKDAEDALKLAQKSATDAENDAHEGVLADIEAEIAKRKAQRDRELKDFERQIKAQEKLLDAQREAEDAAHDARMAAITAEVDAEQDRIDAEDARIDRANTLLDIFKNGITPLTQEQKDYLASLGIDVESLTKANTGLAATKSLLDAINKAISKLPDDKPTRGVLSESQRAALQAALDQGLIDPKDRRVVDVALAGRSVRLDKIRKILEGTTEHLEDQTQQQEDQASLAENILKDLKLQLDLRKQSNDANREALQGDLDAENARHELAKEHLGDELAALKERQAAAKEAWDAEMDALDAAKKAEEDRHKARMTQLQEEYALELLKLGKTDDQIKDILADQARRAKIIADEAQRRFEEWLREVKRLQAEADARESQVERPRTPSPVVPIEPPAPGPGPGPGPIPPPTTDSFLMNTLADAIELKSVMTDLAALGFKAPNNFTVNQQNHYGDVNNQQFRDIEILEGSEASEALLDALGRR